MGFLVVHLKALLWCEALLYFQSRKSLYYLSLQILLPLLPSSELLFTTCWSYSNYVPRPFLYFFISTFGYVGIDPSVLFSTSINYLCNCVQSSVYPIFEFLVQIIIIFSSKISNCLFSCSHNLISFLPTCVSHLAL